MWYKFRVPHMRSGASSEYALNLFEDIILLRLADGRRLVYTYVVCMYIRDASLVIIFFVLDGLLRALVCFKSFKAMFAMLLKELLSRFASSLKLGKKRGNLITVGMFLF